MKYTKTVVPEGYVGTIKNYIYCYKTDLHDDIFTNDISRSNAKIRHGFIFNHRLHYEFAKLYTYLKYVNLLLFETLVNSGRYTYVGT
jgi:hypothetical protein